MGSVFLVGDAGVFGGYEEYLERAFEKLKKNGCPAEEDLMTWFGKLVAAEIIEDALGNCKQDENN